MEDWEIEYIDIQEEIRRQIQAYINVETGISTPAIGHVEILTIEQIIEKYGTPDKRDTEATK